MDWMAWALNGYLLGLLLLALPIAWYLRAWSLLRRYLRPLWAAVVLVTVLALGPLAWLFAWWWWIGKEKSRLFTAPPEY